MITDLIPDREYIVIERPADGNYRLDRDTEDRLLDLLWKGKDGRPNTMLMSRVRGQLWVVAPDIGHAPKLLYTVDDNGWTRPYLHILLDLVERVLNGPIERSRLLLDRIFDSDTADAFVLACFNSGIQIIDLDDVSTLYTEFMRDRRKSHRRSTFGSGDGDVISGEKP